MSDMNVLPMAWGFCKVCQKDIRFLINAKVPACPDCDSPMLPEAKPFGSKPAPNGELPGNVIPFPKI